MPAGLWRNPIPHLNHLKTVLACSLTLVILDTAWAQDHVHGAYHKKHLGPYLSLGIASYREDLIVPLAFHGPDFSLGAVFTQQNQTHLVHIRLRFGMGHLENRHSHEAWVLFQECRLSWVTKLIAHHRYGEFRGGVCIPLQMNNLFFESWDDAHLYWLTSYTAGTALLWMNDISPRNSVNIRLEIPLFGWISRPPAYRHAKQEPLNHWTYHFSEPNSNLHLETLDIYRGVYLEIVFGRQMGRSLFSAGYEFGYDYCKRPEPIRGMRHSIFASYQWSVGR